MPPNVSSDHVAIIIVEAAPLDRWAWVIDTAVPRIRGVPGAPTIQVLELGAFHPAHTAAPYPVRTYRVAGALGVQSHHAWNTLSRARLIIPAVTLLAWIDEAVAATG